MATTLLKNAIIVNWDKIYSGSILINGEKIERIYTGGVASEADNIINCAGLHVFPGVIDDQVHFREPGATYKGCIESESGAAVLGGVTSFMDMPNNIPPALTTDLLENKYKIGAESSYANYSFYLGAGNSNFDELLKADKHSICGIKVFMGSSTGNMLVDNPEALDNIFGKIKMTVATHCEEESVINANMERALSQYGDDIPFSMHPEIRSREACILSTEKALARAVKYGTKLHILHISTKEEIELIKEAKKINPGITAETCVHYLFFNSGDYPGFGGKIKCNPAIKDESDRMALIEAIAEGSIDIIATDHAPHTAEEKNNKYRKCPSGLPLIQHSLQMMIELSRSGNFDLTLITDVMSRRPAKIFGIEQRGEIKEGYYADLAIVDTASADSFTTNHPAYKCGWSPLAGYTFSSQIKHTFVNGAMVVKDGNLTGVKNSKRLIFNYE
jgi:dihydroorotase